MKRILNDKRGSTDIVSILILYMIVMLLLVLFKDVILQFINATVI